MSDHISVLPNEVLRALDIQPQDVVIDGTVNGGGHAKMIANQLGPKGHMIGIDLDPHALVRSRQQLASALCRVDLVQDNFKNVPEVVVSLQIQPSKILLDLGWSTDQFEDEKRGFSFRHEGPLSMRLDADLGKNQLQAFTIVNEWRSDQIAIIIKNYGEERFAKRIADAICQARSQREIRTTTELADIVTQAIPARFRRGRIHPATKTFQALRMAVNDELENLRIFLETVPLLVASHGRIAIISFHSLEDRIVKHMFRDLVNSGSWSWYVKKPVTASEEELSQNPRSRSAKLRCIIKK